MRSLMIGASHVKFATTKFSPDDYRSTATRSFLIPFIAGFCILFWISIYVCSESRITIVRKIKKKDYSGDAV